MTGKLYPPRIEASLPAFTRSLDSCVLVVPFQLNRAVGRNDFNQVRLRIKTVQTNTLLCDGLMTETINFDNSTGQWKAIFDLSQQQLTIGQYYKIQIAFAKNGAIGYYSDMALVKCTAKPNIYIKNLDAATASNSHIYEYTGIYAPTEDITEKVYSYCFNLYDEQNQLIETSGEQLHNASIDTDKAESSDTWLVTKTLKPGHWYSIQYSVTTINNLVVASPAYKIIQIDSVDLNIGTDLRAYMMYDDGYVDLWLKPKAGMNKNIHGSFIVVRASSDDNFNNWQELYRFEIVSEFPDKHLWRDFTVQQGVEYKYALQAFNDNGLYSNRLESIDGIIRADFEDMFLFDGERQLNLKFNPQVSSFKSNILETKVDTIGSQYPFIFRSGHVNYKEFPISGLLSMLTDPNELFIKGVLPPSNHDSRTQTASMGPVFDNPTDLTSDNFYRERQFKMEVLEWLNNGKPKLFRSPGEGNFIVRLMNTSLAPNQTLGRMLHTVSTTAYEVADFNYKNLNKYGFIKSIQRNYREMKINQFSLTDLFNGTIRPDAGAAHGFASGAYFISIANQFTSSLVLDFYFLDGSVINWNVQNPTGQFNIPINESPVVKIVYRDGDIEQDAVITYGEYSVDISNDFSFITNVSIEDRIEQLLGQGMHINIIDQMQDIRQQLGRFYYIKLSPRTVYSVYRKEDGTYYWDRELLHLIDSWDKNAIYEVKDIGIWLNGSPEETLTAPPSFRAQLNGQSFTDLSKIDRGNGQQTSGRFEAISNIDEVTILKLGTGVMADVVYQLKTLEYALEKTDGTVNNAKKQWQYYLSAYNGALANELTTPEQLAECKTNVDVSYEYYIRCLTFAVEKAQEDLIYAI